MLSVVPLRPVYMYVYDDCMSHRVTAIHTEQELELQSVTISASRDRESPTAEESSF
jgi:hypothetical protein